MTAEPPIKPSTIQISEESRRILCGFAAAAISQLSNHLKGKPLEWEAKSAWEQGSDGHFRKHSKRLPVLWRILDDEWLRSVPQFDRCLSQLHSDSIVNRHLDRLVGTHQGASRLDTENILRSFIYSSISEEAAEIRFDLNRFDQGWRTFAEFLVAEQVAYKTIAPLPHFVTPKFPLRINDEIEIDQLTGGEVSKCALVGLLRPQSENFPLILKEIAVGIRWTRYLPKLILTGDESIASADASVDGSFGRRRANRDDLVVDDVLSSLRLFKHKKVAPLGYASWVDFPWVDSGISYRALSERPAWGNYELSAVEISAFQELWQLLVGGAGRFAFSVHRFNLSFDRGYLTDRIVDLVIAAESLFLSDLGVQDRGELAFRFALRAAKFIKHPEYSEGDIYGLMRKAYAARSAVVHGGQPKDTQLPANPSADLQTFTDTIEELVRLALRQALSMKEDGKKLRMAEYWLGLLLPA